MVIARFRIRFLLKTNTSGKQKRGGDFRELDFWSLRSQRSEMLKKTKKRGKEKSGSKNADPGCIVFLVITVHVFSYLCPGALWTCAAAFSACALAFASAALAFASAFACLEADPGGFEVTTIEFLRVRVVK